MLTTGRSAGVFEQIARLLREYEQAKRAGAKAEMLADIANRLLQALAALTQSPVIAQALAIPLKIGKDWMQTALDEAQLSPCEAAKAAVYARQAYTAFDDAVVFLHDWAADRRFWPLPPPFREPLEVRVPPSDIMRQIISLEGFFESALNAVELGLVELLRLRDLRVHLGAEAGAMPVPAVLATGYLIDLPSGPFRSGRERVREMRELLLRVADELEKASNRGREILARATLDDEGTVVRPAAVTAVLAQLNYTIASGVLTCAILRHRVSEPTLAEIRKQSAASNESDKWAE